MKDEMEAMRNEMEAKMEAKRKELDEIAVF